MDTIIITQKQFVLSHMYDVLHNVGYPGKQTPQYIVIHAHVLYMYMVNHRKG